VRRKFLIVIIGPTGIGKTAIGVYIAQKLGTEIISCDSRQIYKELKIGTARPSDEQLSAVKHHFIATNSIFDYYNASMFEFGVLETIENLFAEKDTALMVGGSGLYIDAVCKGIDDLPTIDPEIREKLLKQFENEGIEGLRQQLKIFDPDYYQQVDLRNAKRILKGLEVYQMTGKPYSSFLTQNTKKRDFDIIKIGLTRDRQELYDIIDNRVDMMIEEGLVEEARSVYHAKHLNALNTVGYKELFDFFDGVTDLEKAIELIKRNSRRYAKRQLTYFARDKEINWFHPNEKERILEYIAKSIQTA
jgi:tRNA dimethylallyltransferase